MPPKTAAATDALVGVFFTAESHPGIRQIGTHKPGAVVRVEPAEAVRLVSAKRFQYATAEDAATAAVWLEQFNAAALSSDPAGPATGVDGQGNGATIAPAQE
ncbi:hypothetical protein [Xanthomonas sp. CFBP 7698]|uniref:hypothetical protein n=1 Tax=Xanthomonas sp. CFBP 7698 TaxID=2082399 RepID=UPI000EEB43D2|nr:hypothetical protein [Xanthomonas sp. CFBP 7698]RJS04875.1 hypothetical protein XnspCFBP7698_01025 [Xanthomonas sp. CFBP 7698]